MKGRSYTEEDSRRFRDLIHRRTGISFPDTKENDLMRIVIRKGKDAGFENLRRYYDALSSDKRDPFLDENLINAVTIGETYFFRYKEQWRLIRERFLPEMLRRKREQGNNQVRIWSAGCSTGEEPYTLAITLLESVPDMHLWRIFLLATDINGASLQVARLGIYGKWSFRSTPDDVVRRYFQPVAEKLQVRKEVRDVVTFAPLNLVSDEYPSISRGIHDMDLILCRNVLIYFDDDRIRQISNRLYSTLTPGGLLLLGHSEPTRLMSSQFQLVNESGMICYTRVELAKRTHREHASARIPAHASKAPPPKPEDPLQSARALVASGRHDDALAILLPLAERDHPDATVYLLVAEIYAGRGKYADSRLWVDRLLEQDRLNVDAYRLLSVICEATDQWEEAFQHARKGVFLDPDSVLANYQMACLYRRRGDASKAGKYYRSVLKLIENLPDETTVGGGEGVPVGRMRDAVMALLK